MRPSSLAATSSVHIGAARERAPYLYTDVYIRSMYESPYYIIDIHRYRAPCNGYGGGLVSGVGPETLSSAVRQVSPSRARVQAHHQVTRRL